MSKTESNQRFYEFGPYRIDASERVLLRDGRPVTLTPKLFDTLLALVERSGHIVEKAELMETVWPGTFVEESNLSSSVSLLRKTLGFDEDGKSYIETVARRGYRFAPVVEVTAESPDLILGRRTRTHIVTREEETLDQEEINAPTNDRQSMFSNAAVEVPEITSMEPMLRVTSATGISSSSKWDRRVVLSAILGTITLVSGVLVGLRYLGGNESATKTGAPFAKIRMARLTTIGTAHDAAISPDGKYVVHVADSAGEQSVWLRNIATGSDQEIVPSSRDVLTGLIFTPDGNRICFIRVPGGRFGPNVLYQVPILGGPARELLADIDTLITFSPDGKRFAFARGNPSKGERLLIVANADGTDAQVLVKHKLEDRALVGPAWSPNGESIVFSLGGSGTDAPYLNLMEVRVKDGVEKRISSHQWSVISGISWLRDGSGLIVIGSEEPESNWQISYLSYPAGTVRRITNDLTDYQSVSLTADSSSLVVVQTEQVSDIWVVPDGDSSHSSRITNTRVDGVNGIAWTPDGRIVHVSKESGNQQIWIMNKDGSEKRQLTFEGWNSRPVVSSDGRYIVFTSARNGSNIWRMDLDGSNQKQLTNRENDFSPQITPDNQWVIYTSRATEQFTAWKVPIDGGNPIQITNFFSVPIAVSPKEGQIAYVFDEPESLKRRVAIIPSEGGTPTRVFDFPHPFRQGIRWAPDGRTLTYLGVPRRSKIWSQPLDGGPPRQIADFAPDTIFAFDWSSDGKSLALARGTRTSDVVLIADQP